MSRQTQPDDFDRIAEKIGDRRLAAVLKCLAKDIRDEVRNARDTPKRSDTRESIKLLKRRVEKVQKAIEKISVLDLPAHLETAPLGRDSMRDLSEWCDKALSMISTKGGRPRVPGKVRCAMVVMDAWSITRGSNPGHNNNEAQEACEMYWVACGGKPSRSCDIWRRFIDAARKSQIKYRDYLRDEIRRGVEGTK